MVSKHFIFSVFLNLYVCDAAVFLCSNKKLEISPLQAFTTETLSNLVRELDNPEIFMFRSLSPLLPDVKEIIRMHGYYSTYIPNGEYEDINIEDTTDLSGDYESDAAKIKETLTGMNNTDNLVVIFLPSRRFKREAKELQKPVIYKGHNKKSGIYALLYSSKSLLLRMNNESTTELHLGNSHQDMITYDSRLNVNVVPLDGKNKVTLRFIFSWLNGYWSLSSVRVSADGNGELNLTTNENIMAPAHFSYHCNGQTVFSDANSVELFIYDLQVQTDSRDGKFGDANDCVFFTTAPICSGLFITTLLGIGLIVALTAIMDIKTMDKFDNYKTKNLTITVSE